MPEVDGCGKGEKKPSGVSPGIDRFAKTKPLHAVPPGPVDAKLILYSVYRRRYFNRHPSCLFVRFCGKLKSCRKTTKEVQQRWPSPFLLWSLHRPGHASKPCDRSARF